MRHSYLGDRPRLNLPPALLYALGDRTQSVQMTSPTPLSAGNDQSDLVSEIFGEAAKAGKGLVERVALEELMPRYAHRFGGGEVTDDLGRRTLELLERHGVAQACRAKPLHATRPPLPTITHVTCR